MSEHFGKLFIKGLKKVLQSPLKSKEWFSLNEKNFRRKMKKTLKNQKHQDEKAALFLKRKKLHLAKGTINFARMNSFGQWVTQKPSHIKEKCPE